MVKIAYMLLLIIFILFASCKKEPDKSVQQVPRVQKTISTNLLESNDGKPDYRLLPVASKAKIVNSEGSSSNQKMKKTSFTFSPNYKTEMPRLSKEEIAKAPVVAQFTMNVNGRDADVVVVEKDGLTYDASDGVRIYIPESLKFHSPILEFLYN